MKNSSFCAILGLKETSYVRKHGTGASSRMAIPAHCQLLPGLGKFSFCRLLTVHFSELVKSGTAETDQLAVLVLHHIQAQWSLHTFPEKNIGVSEGGIGIFCITPI